MLQAVRDDVTDDMLPLLDQMMVHLADEGWDREMIGMFVMTVLIMDDELN